MIMIMFRKDARLPVQLQRAMAAEAEAAREARAKVVKMMIMVIFVVGDNEAHDGHNDMEIPIKIKVAL